MQPFSETCLCGRSFAQLFAWSNHRRACKKSKIRLSGALDKAKEAWASRKRMRLTSSVTLPPVVNPSEVGHEDLGHEVYSVNFLLSSHHSYLIEIATAVDCRRLRNKRCPLDHDGTKALVPKAQSSLTFTFSRRSTRTPPTRPRRFL
jgi:hypothetical protein